MSDFRTIELRQKVLALMIIFVLSGVSGLIYQSIWARYLGLFLGHAAYAQALVLCIFMGGMAAGAALIARRSERWSYLIRLYAYIELIIGLMAFVFHGVFNFILDMSFDVVIPAIGADWLVHSYKWVISALIIVPQTVLLGMTFPLMSAGIIRMLRGKRNGHALGMLYFLNSIGAALGVLAVAFYIIPLVGLPGSLVAAGIVNVAVAFVAWRCVDKTRDVPAEQPKQELKLKRPLLVSQNQQITKLVLFCTFISGAASFVYEIVWIRLLSLTLGSTFHAFELMLAAFILGIALGGLWVRRLMDSKIFPLLMVGWIQILMGGVTLVSLVLYSQSFTWVSWVLGALANSDSGYSIFNLFTALVALVIMMPAAIFAGMTLPLFTHTLLQGGVGEKSIGKVYAWNTLGAILGVSISIFVLVPAIGLRLTLILAALVDVGVGGLLLWRYISGEKRQPYFLMVAASTLVLLIAVMHVFPVTPKQLGAGVFRSSNAELPEDVDVVFYKDGKTSTVSVAYDPNGTASIATNGKVDAAMRISGVGAMTADEPTMVLLGAIPMAYQTQPKKIGVVGFGSGMTTHTLLADPNLVVVDTIEIEKAMYDGAKFFSEKVSRAYDDPRSNVVIDDAKSYFSSRKSTYDAIISEPSNPWVNGVGALFTQEFYRRVPEYLTPDGVFVQWLQLYEISDQQVASVLAAIKSSFDDYEAYLSYGSDMIIVASNGELPEENFQALLEGPLRSELTRIGVQDTQDLESRRVLNAALVNALPDLFGALPNSDYFPRLMLDAPKSRFKKEHAEVFAILPTLKIPLLEYMGVRDPIPVNGIGKISIANPAVHVTNLANQLYGNRLGWAEVDASNYANLMRMHHLREMLDCTKKGEFSADIIARELKWLLESTWAYLRPDDQKYLFIEPDWISCEVLPDGLAEVMEIFKAIASRNARVTIELVGQWLADNTVNESYRREFSELFYTAMLLSQFSEKDYSAVLQSQVDFGGAITETPDYQLVRRLVLLMSYSN